MQRVLDIGRIGECADFIGQAVIDYILEGQIETYESFGDYDLIAFDWYDLKDADVPPAQIILYIDRDDLFCICENETARCVAQLHFTPDELSERALFLFFKSLFRGNANLLEQLEARAAALDDDVSDGTEPGLRERLMEMRDTANRACAYYGQMALLLEEICDNDGGLLSAESLKGYRVLRSRCARLASQANGLRGYVTQVRDSYLAQISIEQNSLMKAFTLVTSIFLPLTLIVGWYGMNLRMPEFGWEHGYAVVIGLCLLVCGVWFAVFKRKKWL